MFRRIFHPDLVRKVEGYNIYIKNLFSKAKENVAEDGLVGCSKNLFVSGKILTRNIYNDIRVNYRLYLNSNVKVKYFLPVTGGIFGYSLYKSRKFDKILKINEYNIEINNVSQEINGKDKRELIIFLEKKYDNRNINISKDPIKIYLHFQLLKFYKNRTKQLYHIRPDDTVMKIYSRYNDVCMEFDKSISHLAYCVYYSAKQSKYLDSKYKREIYDFFKENNLLCKLDG